MVTWCRAYLAIPVPTALEFNCLHENACHSAAKVKHKHSLSSRLAQCLAGCKHVSGNRWLSRALHWGNQARKDCRIKAAPDKNTAMQNVLQVVRQPNSPPANPASSTQPPQPSPPTPTTQHPASKPPKHDKLFKLYGFPQGLGITVNSDVFAERIKHRKNIRI